MTPEQMLAVEAVLQEALALPEQEQQAYVADRCSDDPLILKEAIALLNQGSSPGAKALDAGPITGPRAADPVVPGYRIIEPLGQGGMGTVYLAEKDDAALAHRVAVKVLKRGMDTDVVVQRFYAERNILAALNHPNIARLYDGGVTADGRPFFVMEYLEGTSLTDYCDDTELNLNQRLALFRKVCAAVSHAHGKLIVHRDLKPQNILVTPEGEPKLLDFGIAKLLADDGRPASALTETGQVPMTPAYAAPEQLRGETVGTAADVYSLGIVLYRLVTSRPPFKGRRRVDLVTGNTRKPSSMVLKLAQSELPGLGSPKKLSRKLAGDLDSIIAMAMRPEPERRYASVEQFSEDLRRHLESYPVSARRWDLAYTVTKTVKRHFWVLATTALMLITATTAAVTVWHEQRLTAAALAKAALERDTAQEIAKVLTEVFVEADPESRRGLEPTAKELLDRALGSVQRDVTRDARLRGSLLTAMGKAYHGLGRYDTSLALLNEARTLAAASGNETREELAEALFARGTLYSSLGRFGEAETDLCEAIRLFEAVLGPDHLKVALARNSLVVCFLDKGDPDRAERHLTLLKAQDRRVALPDDVVAGILMNQGHVHHWNNQLDRAAQAYFQSIQRTERYSGTENIKSAGGHHNLGTLYLISGRLALAEQHLTKALSLRQAEYGLAHQETAATHGSLGRIFLARNEFAQAEVHALQSLEGYTQVFGPHHGRLIFPLSLLGTIKSRQDDLPAAVRFFERSLGVARAHYGRCHYQTAIALNNVGSMQRKAGKFAAAEAALREAREMVLSLRGDVQVVGSFEVNLATALIGRGREDEARFTAEAGLARVRRLRGAHHPKVMELLVKLARAYRDYGYPAEALVFATQAVALIPALLPDHPGACDEAVALYESLLPKEPVP